MAILSSRFMAFMLNLLLIMAFSIACTADQTEPIEATRPATMTVTPTPLPATATAMLTATAVLPTATATAVPPTLPIAIASPTASPTQTPQPTSTPILTFEQPPISPENEIPLTHLMQFGSGRVQAGSWSPDGKLFAIHTSQGIDLYDTQTQEFIGTVDNVTQAALWSAPTSQNPVVSETRQPIDLGFSPVATSLVTEIAVELYQGTTLRLYDMNNGERYQTINLSAKGDAFAFNPQGDRLLVYHYEDQLAPDYDQLASIWDVKSGTLLRTVTLPHGQAQVKFSHQGDQLIFQGNDGYFRIGDVHDPNLDRVLEGERSFQSQLIFSPDDRILAFNDFSLVRLWDTTTGKLLHQLPIHYTTPRPLYYWLPIAFSPDSRHLAIVTESAALVFDVVSGEQAYSLGNYFTPGLAYTPDGTTLFTAGGYDVYAWDAHSGQLLQTWASTIRVRTVAISPDNQLMAWGGGDQHYKVQMWHRTTGELLYTVEQEASPIHGLVFSPDGQVLATIPALFESNPRVWLWETNSGRPLYNYPGNNIAFSPDGRLLLTSITTNYNDATIEVRETSSGNLLFSFPGLSLTPSTSRDWDWNWQPVAFSPDGRFLANAHIVQDGSKTVELLDTTTFEIVRRFESSELVGFNSDGTMLVWSYGQGKPYLERWDVATGALLDSIQRQGSWAGSIGQSPDGRFVLGWAFNHSYNESRLACWDLNSGRYTWFSDMPGTTLFSPDSRSLTTIDDNDILHLWSLPPGP